MKVIKWVLIIFGLILFNFLVTEYLLRVSGLAESILESRLDKELKSADYIFDFSPKMKERLVGLVGFPILGHLKIRQIIII